MVVPRRAGEAMIRTSYIVPHPDPWDIPPPWVLHLFQDRAPNGLPRFLNRMCGTMCSLVWEKILPLVPWPY